MHKFVESIEREYKDYKAAMLKNPPEQIWDKCCEIYFYSSFYEYFPPGSGWWGLHCRRRR